MSDNDYSDFKQLILDYAIDTNLHSNIDEKYLYAITTIHNGKPCFIVFINEYDHDGEVVNFDELFGWVYKKLLKK